MLSSVAIARCRSYDDTRAALRACLGELGGMRAFVRRGERVLLKVNLVSAHHANRAVTTHPAVVSALIGEIREAGGIPAVGDSPALAAADKVAQRAGLATVCAEERVPIVSLDQPAPVAAPQAKSTRAFRLSKKLDLFEVIVNVPKLKTHSLVGMTCAVKNMFGCIPGTLKTAHHVMQPDPIAFAEMLLALHATVVPALTVVDGVLGLEGDGPGAGGEPRLFGVLVAARDSIAVDAVCARVLGFQDREVPTLWLARQRGIPEADLSNVEVRGEQIAGVEIRDLKRAKASLTTRVPRGVMRIGKRLLTHRPTLRPGQCRLCGDCLEICAPRAIAMTSRGPCFDDGTCIRCYCCHEVCPAGAISLQAGLLSGLLGR